MRTLARQPTSLSDITRRTTYTSSHCNSNSKEEDEHNDDEID